MSIGGQSEASQVRSEQKIYRLTPEGYAKKQERLEYLRTVKRKEIADYIHEAKEAGDISESSAYEDAKNEQAKVEGEILQLERLLSVAEVMTSDMHNEISDQSPVGKALMGHQEGDSVNVATPGGVTNYTIRSIRPML